MPTSVLIIELVAAAIREANEMILLHRELETGSITEDEAKARLADVQKRFKEARDAWNAA